MRILKKKSVCRVRTIFGWCLAASLLYRVGGLCAADEYPPYLAAQMQAAADDEQLPDPGNSSQDAFDDCLPPDDGPLATLTVDIEPIDRPGQIELDPSLRPTECAAPVLAGAAPIYMGFQPLPHVHWPVSPGAQFCHHPLYFEEPCLERHGCTNCCCQPAASAAHFFGTALLLPIKMCGQCPGRGVCTPSAF
jgi:hypothetical protein